MKSMSDILKQAANSASGIIAVAAAHDEDVLKAVIAARKQNIARAILVGGVEKITAILRELGEDPAAYELISAETDANSAEKAVACVTEGRAKFLMKGLLSTADMMRAVIDKEKGLRTELLISHVMIYECQAYSKLIFVTDAGMNTFPDLQKKADILENAAIVAKALGYDQINAACVCAAEAVDPKIQSTVDAKELSKMTDRWVKYNMNVYGPVGLDLAISREACRHKRFSEAGAGEADILLVPNYEMGNGISKSISYFGGGKNAGIIVGAKVPIVLVSRSDSAESKLASIALGSIIVGR